MYSTSCVLAFVVTANKSKFNIYRAHPFTLHREKHRVKQLASQKTYPILFRRANARNSFFLLRAPPNFIGWPVSVKSGLKWE